MNNKLHLVLLLILTTFVACKDNYSDLKDGLYAEIETSKGTILLELDYKKAPVTVANFVTLAEGKNNFVAQQYKGKPFYNGLFFHRVLENFMIQTGDPLGSGAGDAGYSFFDEINDLKHNTPGVLSMANSGPNTNSSQFFITHVPTPWLDGRHTVFGHVVSKEDQDVVNSIAQGDEMIAVRIIRKGEDVKRFDAVKTFTDGINNQVATIQRQQEEATKLQLENEKKYKPVIDAKRAYFAKWKPSSSKLASGLRYYITQKSSGERPKEGKKVTISYQVHFENGTLLDTSDPEIAKQFGKLDENRLKQANGYSKLDYTMGSNRLIPGFVEGLNKLRIGEKAILYVPYNLAYGEQGSNDGFIPPKSNLVFEIYLEK
jgi:cyclophilin family peptidyl-prolyl cis-trans isomerase